MVSGVYTHAQVMHTFAQKQFYNTNLLKSLTIVKYHYSCEKFILPWVQFAKV